MGTYSNYDPVGIIKRERLRDGKAPRVHYQCKCGWKTFRATLAVCHLYSLHRRDYLPQGE